MNSPNAIDWFPPQWLTIPPGELLAAPKMGELLDHFERELARKNGGLRNSEHESMSASVRAARQAIDRGDVHAAAMSFFLLGMVVQRLSTAPRGEELTDLLRAELSEHQRQLPLKRKSLHAQHAKGWAQDIARALWEQDEHEGVRVAEMADLVWMQAASAGSSLFEAFPDNAVGLRAWLREVAPPSAKKAGRPRK